MVEELKCSLMWTFSGEGRRPVNFKVLEVVGLQCMVQKLMLNNRRKECNQPLNLRVVLCM